MINHQYFELKNGFQSILCPLQDRKIAYLSVFVRTGSNQETEAERGFAHFTEHLVFKSTDKYPQNSIMEKVSQLGGSINAFTEYNCTCFYLLLPSQHIKKGLEILSQLTRWANFSEEEFATEKGVVIEELYQYQNDPDEWFFENCLADFFRQANYRYPIIGNEENLSRSTPKDLKNFYQQNYTPSNCFLVATGDLPKQMETLVKDFFDSWSGEKAECTPLNEEALNQHKKSYKFFKKDVEKPQLNFIFNSPAQSEPDYLPFAVASTILADQQNALLPKELKQNLGLVDHLMTCDIGQTTSGALLVQIFPQKETCQVVQKTQKIVEDFSENGCTYNQYQHALKILANSHKFGLESCEDLGVQLGLSHLSGNYRFTLEFCQKLTELSYEQVQATIKKYFSDYQIYHMGLSPVQLEKKAKQTTNNIPRENLFCYKLFPNFKIVLKKESHRQTCGICLTTSSAMRKATAEQLGIQSLCTHLLVYGNQEQNHSQFIDFCQENGLKFSIDCDEETTSVTIKCFEESLSEALQLLALTYSKPRFEQKQFDLLKSRYLSNLQREQDYPVAVASKMFRQAVFGKDNPIVHKKGTKRSLQAIDILQVREWHRQHFLSQDFVLSIVGNFQPEKIISACQKVFADFANSIAKIEKPLPCPIAKNLQIRKTLKNSTQDIVCLLGATGDATNVKESTAFALLSQIIGGNISSRMFDILREKLGIAYSCGFSHSKFLDFGYFKSVALVQKGAGEKALQNIRKILQEVAQDGVTSDELQMSKSYLSNLMLFHEEDPLNIANMLAHLEFMGFGYLHLFGYHHRIKESTAKDLQDVAQKYFQNYNTGIYIDS